MSASAIAWIVSIAFILILVAGFFVGFWRGLKRSWVNVIFAVVGVLVAFFITPPITNAIMGIEVSMNGEPTSLADLILSELSSDSDLQIIIDRNPNLATFIKALPGALANTIVFLIITIAVELVLYIIFKIVAVTALKYREGTSKHRVWGGVVGLAKTFVVMVFAFMPLAALGGLYDDVTSTNITVMAENGNEENNTDTGTETQASIVFADVQNDQPSDQQDGDQQNGTGENQSGNLPLAEAIPPEVDEIISGINKSALFKICGVFGLDNATFDYLSQVKIDGEKIYVRQEIVNLYPIAEMAYQMSEAGDSIDYSKIDYESLEKYINTFTESGLFRGIMVDFVSDIICNYDKYPFASQIPAEFQDIFTALQDSIKNLDSNQLKEYFANDINNVITAMKNLGQNGLLSKLMSAGEESILDILVADENITSFETLIDDAFNFNIIQDAIGTVAQVVLDNMLSDLDKIGTDTSSWTENDWAELKTNIVSVAQNFSQISKEVEIDAVLSDPTILVSHESNYNISNVTGLLGQLVDNLRANKLLQTSTGVPIIDKLLAQNNFGLPTSPVKDLQGSDVVISSYSQLFDYITPSMIAVKENDLMTLFQNSSVISDLADLISQEGKNDLLKQVILPLSQVEPTKTLIVDDLLKTIKNEVVDFSTLSTYEDWNSDLGYISQVLIEMNKVSVGDQTLLDSVLAGDFEQVLSSLSTEQVDNIFKPVLYAKSTKALADSIFEQIASSLSELSSAQVTVSLEGATLIEGNDNDQAAELCQVIKDIVALNQEISAGGTFRDLDRILLANLLTDMQTNAYRASSDGVFQSAFVALVDAFKLEYQNEISASSELQEKLSSSNYPNINFTEIFDLLEQLENM